MSVLLWSSYMEKGVVINDVSFEAMTGRKPKEKTTLRIPALAQEGPEAQNGL